ncbi:hypothetical protein LTR10_005756 [Elasticomyces elasticus]|nr:hypothetical protein LTR10_005756 [Elasticomyces elasticus]KAK4964964.1 hypothetical protein LTR42_012381 [Elasticomyces elasticus]
MAFLRRSKSQRVKEAKEIAPPLPLPPPPAREPEQEQEATEPTWKQERRQSRSERRKSIFRRSKSASDIRKSGSIEHINPESESAATPLPALRSRDLPSHLSVIGETVEILGDTYRFPTPSPRFPPQARRSTSVRSQPQSPKPIGLAIGSPTQVPPSWGRSYTADEINGRMGRTAPVVAQPQHVVPEHRVAEVGALPPIPKKESRWKMLGGLFGRKGAKPAGAEPFYKVQIPQQSQQPQPAAPRPFAKPLVETPSPSPGVVQFPGSISSHHIRTPSINRGMARFEARAEADLRSFMPKSTDSQIARTGSHASHGSIGTLSPAKPLEQIRNSADIFKTMDDQSERRDSPMSAKIVNIPAQSGNRGVVQPGAVPRTPKLDLDIPGAEMERYSVMFEKLLEPRQSILERRQSKAQRQRSIRKDLPAIPSPISCGPSPIELRPTHVLPSSRAVPQRSMTSPHLNRVPSLTVGLTSKRSAGNLAAPSQEYLTSAVHRPRPIRRTKTAPAGSVSPVAPNFSRLSRPKLPPTSFMSSAEDLTPVSPSLGDDSAPPTPTTIASMPGTENVAVLRHEPISVTKRRTTKRNDSVDEQSWDMLTSVPASPPSASPHAQYYPNIRTQGDLERQIVQVSVARQVSVTKARRLVQRAQVESKQPLRPRVVEMKGREGVRKSSHVVFVGGDDDV